ncbi:alcohol dehydrogenase catalytic domain-containing protein, partial [Rhodococcus hoagii]|nr:alcohol dehydrogenase catalytic domain-containing protein [Prescottella equi]
MKAVRVHEYDQHRRSTRCPRRPCRARNVIVRVEGAVCAEPICTSSKASGRHERRSAPVHDRPRERRHGDRDRSAVTNVAVGDKSSSIRSPPAACAHACRSGDDVHCTASDFPGIDAEGGMAEYLRTSARSVSSSTRRSPPADVAALARCRADRVPRGPQGRRDPAPGTDRRGHRRRRARPHRHPGSEGTHRGTHRRRRRPVRPPPCSWPRRSRRRHVVADGTEAERVLELTGGAGAEAVLDFVGEGTAIAAGVAMLRRAGSYYVIGYGGNLDIPTIDVISTEINFVGNLVGT